MDTCSSSAAQPNWFDCGCRCDILDTVAAGSVETANLNCSESNPNYIFDPENCGCECGIDSNTGCSTLSQPDWFDCGCRCDILDTVAAGNVATADSNCSESNPNYIFDAVNCGCECGIDMNTGCSTLSQPDWFDCGCRCDILDTVAEGDVVTANSNCSQSNPNYIFDAVNCGCECGIDMNAGCSTLSKPDWFDCGCQCDFLTIAASGSVETAN